MRVIDAEKLDQYLTDVIRGARIAEDISRRSGDPHGLVPYYRKFAEDLTGLADNIAEMSQEGNIYLTTPEQLSDMGGRQLKVSGRGPAFPNEGRVSPLHSKE